MYKIATFLYKEMPVPIYLKSENTKYKSKQYRRLQFGTPSALARLQTSTFDERCLL